MTIRRAARGLFAFAILLFTTFASAPPGATQSPVPVTLRLVSQTPWNTPRDTVLEVAVRADSTGAEPIDELTLGITIGTAGAVTHRVRGVAHRRPGAADLRDHDPRTRRARAERHAPLPRRGRPVDDRGHQRHGVAHLSDADRRAERRDPGSGTGLARDLPGPHARGPAPALDLDRALGTDRVRPERGDGRRGVRGVLGPVGLTRRAGGRPGSDGQRPAPRLDRPGDPADPPRPARADGRRVRTRRRQPRRARRRRRRARSRADRPPPRHRGFAPDPGVGDAFRRTLGAFAPGERTHRRPGHAAGGGTRDGARGPRPGTRSGGRPPAGGRDRRRRGLRARGARRVDDPRRGRQR